MATVAFLILQSCSRATVQEHRTNNEDSLAEARRLRLPVVLRSAARSAVIGQTSSFGSSSQSDVRGGDIVPKRHQSSSACSEHCCGEEDLSLRLFTGMILGSCGRVLFASYGHRGVKDGAGGPWDSEGSAAMRHSLGGVLCCEACALCKEFCARTWCVSFADHFIPHSADRCSDSDLTNDISNWSMIRAQSCVCFSCCTRMRTVLLFVIVHAVVVHLVMWMEQCVNRVWVCTCGSGEFGKPSCGLQSVGTRASSFWWNEGAGPVFRVHGWAFFR